MMHDSCNKQSFDIHRQIETILTAGAARVGATIATAATWIIAIGALCIHPPLDPLTPHLE